MQPPPRAIKVEDGFLVEKEALWTMLSGDAESEKQKEANICEQYLKAVLLLIYDVKKYLQP